MAKIYLRPIGGLGARLIPLLQGLSAVRESSHELVVCWPLSSRRGGGRSGAHREQSFELPLTDLYDFDPPITDMRESAYLAKTEELPYYPLRHTQNLDGSGQETLASLGGGRFDKGLALSYTSVPAISYSISHAWCVSPGTCAEMQLLLEGFENIFPYSADLASSW